MKNKSYYLGLDIGTDSIGYAVTDEKYKLLRFKGESIWGSGLFDPASPCADRRVFRTARRRLDRRQQRVRILREFFAKAIAEVDPRFFVRLRESALFAEDRTDPLDNQTLFNDPTFKDTDFHRQYPTIHHLILELMNNSAPHDPRLVYAACAWLVAHRGHFFSEVSVENVSALDDVTELYEDMMAYMKGEAETEDGETTEPAVMWSCDPKAFGEILAKRIGVSAKRDMMKDLLWHGEKPKSDDVAYDRMEVISLLCGSDTVKPAKLFRLKAEEYADLGPLSLGADDEKLAIAIADLGEDGELIRKLKALYDWGVLRDIRQGASSISAAKVAVYDQHRKDLDALKSFLKAHDLKLYRKVFSLCDGKTPNYYAYVYNAKKAKDKALIKRADKDAFSDWLKKEMSAVSPNEAERAFYEDMMERLVTRSFLPKQTDGENRVIPHQLYQAELRAILKNAKGYLRFLSDEDEYGSVADKIESVFAFRVPYFVGPLVTKNRSPFAWMIRKCEDGVIRPWNFKDLVDLDASEDEFIRKMTNSCQYVPGADVLPADSLLYREFELLNELNPLKVAGEPLPREAKERVVEFFRSHRRVTRPALEKFLQNENLLHKGDEITGIDETIKTSLTSYHAFKPWLLSGALTIRDVESIVARSACTEDSDRLLLWLGRQPFANKIPDKDRRKMSQLKFSEFGRLSAVFLSGIVFESKETGEKGTVIEFLRRKNVVLMELLSERYTLRDELRKIEEDYYREHPATLEQRLDKMYVSSAVKRQIYRALDVVKTIRKVMGAAPKKIFVEMARGGAPEQKGRRTKTRYNQVVELYKNIQDVEVKEVNAELERMGDRVDNRLQADALFLWTLQLGRCAYCGKSLPVEGLKSVANIDHIHPQAIVKDDSVINNKVLCCSECNGKKRDSYPVPEALRQESLWTHWHKMGLMSPEKYARLMRREMLADEELQGFINRQLVETRQTTKAVFTVLSDMFKIEGTEVIAVKAGNVSDFRHEFGLVKCRAVNDLHHAKDAYLNIVVGNVYHERFSRQSFRLSDGYTMKVGKLFGEGSRVENAHGLAWDGVRSLARVKETMARNDIHLTKYAFFAKGGFFDQMPKGPGSGAIPRKAGLSPEKYGGYLGVSYSGFLLVKYRLGKKLDIFILPVGILDKDRVLSSDDASAKCEIRRLLREIVKGNVEVIGYPCGRRLLKKGAILALDGVCYVLCSHNKKQVGVRLFSSVVYDVNDESYIKRIESVLEKCHKNSRLVIDEKYDGITSAANIALYDRLLGIFSRKMFQNMPASQFNVIKEGRGDFSRLDLKAQLCVLMGIVTLLKTNRTGTVNLGQINGSPSAGNLTIPAKFSNLKKHYADVRLVESDFSGLFRNSSGNLLDLL